MTSLLDFAADGVLVYEITAEAGCGRFIRVNREICAMLGYGPAALRSRTLLDIVPPEQHAALRRDCELLAREGVLRHETVLSTKDGRLIPVEIASRVLPGKRGRRVLSIVRDISERKRFEEDIVQRSVELEAANLDLETFGYSVSHDLRAPLRAIDGFSQILISEHGPSLDPEPRRYLSVIRENARRMNEIVDALLALSRLSRQALSTETLDPAVLVREALDLLQPELKDRSVEFVIGQLPPCQGDPALLRQVFVNLLSNAVKYTRPRPAARIEIGSLPGTTAPVYYVRDNGVGFNMRDAGRLFGVFQRLHPAGEFEGTGAGLAIVQRIIRRHGGRVWAHAEPGCGAAFYFHLRGALPAPKPVATTYNQRRVPVLLPGLKPRIAS